MSFYEKETEKIELVARPGLIQRSLPPDEPFVRCPLRELRQTLPDDLPVATTPGACPGRHLHLYPFLPNHFRLGTPATSQHFSHVRLRTDRHTRVRRERHIKPVLELLLPVP